MINVSPPFVVKKIFLYCVQSQKNNYLCILLVGMLGEEPLTYSILHHKLL